MMCHIIKEIAILITFLSLGTLSCPPGIGWISGGDGTCYLVSSEHTNWFVAEKVSTVLGSYYIVLLTYYVKSANNNKHVNLCLMYFFSSVDQKVGI